MDRADKFINDGLFGITMGDGKCESCIHVDENGLTCDAFTDGIPVVILNGNFDHSEPYDGDNGIQYKERK